jgi:hypothetical protein
MVNCQYYCYFSQCIFICERKISNINLERINIKLHSWIFWVRLLGWTLIISKNWKLWYKICSIQSCYDFLACFKSCFFSTTNIINWISHIKNALLSIYNWILCLRLLLEWIKNAYYMGHYQLRVWIYVSFRRLCFHSICIFCSMSLFNQLSWSWRNFKCCLFHYQYDSFCYWNVYFQKS